MNAFPSNPNKQKSVVARFVETARRYNHPVIIGNRPKALVEEPVGVFAEGDAVLRMVVAAVGKLVNVGRVHDAAGIHGYAAVAG